MWYLQLTLCGLYVIACYAMPSINCIGYVISTFAHFVFYFRFFIILNLLRSVLQPPQQQSIAYQTYHDNIKSMKLFVLYFVLGYFYLKIKDIKTEELLSIIPFFDHHPIIVTCIREWWYESMVYASKTRLYLKPLK